MLNVCLVCGFLEFWYVKALQNVSSEVHKYFTHVVTRVLEVKFCPAQFYQERTFGNVCLVSCRLTHVPFTISGFVSYIFIITTLCHDIAMW